MLLIALMLGNQLGFIDLSAFTVPEAHAQEGPNPDHNELGIMAILVEESLLDDNTSYDSQGDSALLRERIFAYAENAQARLPHTRAIVIGVDPDETTFKIATVLEKMYFEGVDNDLLDEETFNDDFLREDDNKLVGIVLVGDIPIPVVYEEEGEPHPSLYPYTDFYRKRYIYNHNTGHFEENTDSLNPTPDIWHGVIIPPSHDDTERRQQLADYFYKNNQYSHGLDGYDEFNRRVLTYNFPAVEKKLNTLDYNNYKRKMKWIEELAFKRLNRHVLSAMLDEIAAEMEPDVPPSERTRLIDAQSISLMSDTATEFIIGNFTSSLTNALKTYISRFNPIMNATGRWSSDEYDSFASLITVRDEYMEKMLMGKMIELENQINDAIQGVQQDVPIIDKVSIRILEAPSELKSLELHAFSDGQRIQPGMLGRGIFGLDSVQKCGLLAGQQRPPGVPVIENNSVLTQLNQIHNPDSVVIPEKNETRDLQDTYAYNAPGGCVANNAISTRIDYDDNDEDIHIHTTVGPDKCNPRSAVDTVRDVVGAKELVFELYDPTVPAPSVYFQPLDRQCEIEYLSYNPSKILPEGHYKEINNDRTPFLENAWCHGDRLNPCYEAGVKNPFNNNFQTWFTMITQLFLDMESKGELDFDFDKNTPEGAVQYQSLINQPHLQVDTIISALFDPYKFFPIQNKAMFYGQGYNDTINYNFNASLDQINSVIEHREPTDETITSIKKFVTPNTPADGIHYVEWFQDDVWKNYIYPNLFRVEGISLDEVQGNLDQIIAQKDNELNNLLGSNGNIIRTFFDQNIDLQSGRLSLLEPMLWRNIGIDMKHQSIVEKYLNRDSFLPIPDPTSIPPVVKPKGYEVFHLYADGTENGFQFALNSPRINKAALIDPVVEAAQQALASAALSGPASVEDDGGLQGSRDYDNLFACGPADGVEIWEWFGAVMCWIEEEITQLDQLISLDNSCGVGGLPETEGDEYDPSAIFNTLENTELAINNPATVPVSIEVEIDKRTLERNESTKLTVKVLNSEGRQIIGYVPDPVEFTVSDTSLAHFDKSELPVFTGEIDVNLIAETALGVTDLNIQMGSLSVVSISIRVVEDIVIELSASQVTGVSPPQYNVTALLFDSDGNQITNVDTQIKLSPINPSDGIFTGRGLMRINDGQGSLSFFPTPTSLEIDIGVTHPVYSSTGLHISQPPNQPFQIIIDAPKDLPVGKSVQVPVRVTDVNKVLSTQFNDSINVQIGQATSLYASLVSQSVSIVGGQGTIRINVGNETAPLTLIAEHSLLIPATAEIPIVAKITTDDWDEMFTQSLFGSFVGFPAANFLKEDYFGGTHLFNGKTQAVFGFMTTTPLPPVATVHPNYRIETTQPRQVVKVASFGDTISLEVFDNRLFKSLLSTTVQMDFSSVQLWVPNSDLDPGTLYFELTNPDFRFELNGPVIDIFDREDELILTLQKNQLQFHDLKYDLFHEPDSQWNLLELILASELGEVGRLYLNFEERRLTADDFNLHPDYAFRQSFNGKSTRDPTGLILYDPTVEPDENLLPPEKFGFVGDNKYILRFGGGSPVGEAVMYNLPTNAVLLGDPTIRLQNNSASSLNYDSTIGQQIYQDTDGADIISITGFEMNNDGIQDIAAVLKDGRIRLFEGGHTEPPYRDRGNLAFNSDGAISTIPFDFKNDGYDDLLVATREGRLAVMHNDNEVITRTDIQLKVGKQLYQILKNDMDADGYEDLVTLDSRGDIRIFYNQTPVLLGQGATLPIPAKDQIPENGKLIGNYGFSLKLGQNLKRDLKVRYPGMPEPQVGGAPPVAAVIPTEEEYELQTSTGQYSADYEIPDFPDMQALIDFPDLDTSDIISDDDAFAFVEAQREALQKNAETGGSAEIPKLPWKEGDSNQAYFAPITDFENVTTQLNNGLFFSTTKTVINKDRPSDADLDLDESLLYTIRLSASRNINSLVLVDTVPDFLTLDEKSIACEGIGCEDMSPEPNSIYLFIANLNIQAGEPITITYEATVKRTPKATILLKKIDKPTTLISGLGQEFQAPIDLATDIMVSPPYNNTGQLVAHYTVGPRTYNIAATKKDETALEAAYALQDQCLAALEELNDALSGLDLEDEDFEPPDEDIMDDVNEFCGTGAATDTVMNQEGTAASPNPGFCATNPSACATESMEEEGFSIGDLSCLGGGCLPMPYNTAFLGPQGIPFAMPVLAFPTTMITPVGPIPVPGSLAMIPMPLGHTDVPGTYNSLIRLYVMPSLTAGVGIGLCWGPYMGTSPVPPAMVPIAYPPPIGNCMTIAIPMSEAPHCKLAEQAMTAAVEAATSVVSDINSGISAINTGAGTDVVGTTDEQGAGGMEVSLAVNLGDANTFEPPAKGFSNIHIPSFDSIGGVIGSWLDKQMLEIMNKLLTMPTIRVILPDIQQLWSNDWEEFEKQVAQFKGTSPVNRPDEPPPPAQKDSGGYIEGHEAIEREILNFNTNQLSQVYQILNALPIIEIREHYIDFKVPWLSFAQINDFIRDLEQAKDYYQRQLQEYEDLFEKYQCPDIDTPDDSLGAQVKAGSECAVKKIIGLFVVDIDTFIMSIIANIEVVQSYSSFPRDFVLLKRELADYIRQIACYLDVYAEMMGGWLLTIQDQIVSYAELIYTILEIIENIKDLMNVFTNFEDNCDICTNERNANFGWASLLGLVIPEIPIIKFPKFPDLTIDFTDFTGQISIEMPNIHFIPEPIKIPKIPRIPFPEIPDLSDLNLLAQIPPLPILPALPELPELPELPAIPKIDLPTLPPPPKLPDIGSQFEAIIPLMDLILNAWCMTKKSFAPVPEAYLTDHVTLLTNRPSYLTPLDILKPSIGNVAGLELPFDELRIETTIYLGVRLKATLEVVAEKAKIWNEAVTNFSGLVDAAAQAYILGPLTERLDAISEGIEQGLESVVDDINKAFDEKVQGQLDELGVTFENVDQFFRNIESDAQAASDWLTETMGSGTEAINQGLVNVLFEFNEQVMGPAGEAGAEAMRSPLAGIIIGFAISPGAYGASLATEALIDLANEHGVNAEGLQGVLDEWNEMVTDWENCTIHDDCPEEEPTAYHRTTPPLPVAAIPSNIRSQLVNAVADLGGAFEELSNEDNWVDYRIVKEKLGVPDYHLPLQPTFVDKIRSVKHQMVAYSEQLEKEAYLAYETTDIIQLLGINNERPELPFALASVHKNPTQPEDRQVFTSSVTPVASNDGKISSLLDIKDPDKLKATLFPEIQPKVKAEAGIVARGGKGPCVGTCLVDPITETTVQFIPYFDNPAITQTAFIRTGIPGQSHVVYSDGPTLYFKRNWDVPSNITTNIPPRVPNIIFDLDHFITLGNRLMPLKESVNMLGTTLTQNGSATFTWMDVTNPDFYGYGIEMERSVLGYDADNQQNALADVTIVLLPPEDGVVPEVRVGDQIIGYGTLVTTLDSEEEAQAKFGIEPRRFVTGASNVRFVTVGNVTISLNDNRAVYFEQYTGSTFSMDLDNGFYHIKMTWFDRIGRIANYNHNELLAPQKYVSASPPVDILFDRKYLTPIYKETKVNANEIYADFNNVYEYYWDTNNDGLPDVSGDVLTLAPQLEPREFVVTLIATPDIEDPGFERFEKEIPIKIYVPEIKLDESTLKSEGVIQGTMKPAEIDHDLSNIPFSLFRKRWGLWRNLGLVKRDMGNPSDPPLSERSGWPDNYYAVTAGGDYEIKNLTRGISPVFIQDGVLNDVARVLPFTGQIEMVDFDYHLEAIPASKLLPTRVSIVKNGFDTVLANVYYVSDENTDVVILDEPLNQTNLNNIGVTLGDSNLSDSIISRNMPGYAESYPGGAAIFDEVTQLNVALINSDGAVRMMQGGYFLRIKNEGVLDEKIIFEIVDSFANPVFDIYIGADFTHLEIRQEEVWNQLSITIGYLKEAVGPLFAALIAQNKPSIPKPAAPAASPFPDLDSSHPFYEQILDLYKRRIISGYGDGSFRPNAKLSRAEFIKIALGSTKCTDCTRPTDAQRDKYTPIRPFPDVSLPAWYLFCVSIAKDLEMITGYGDGQFKPERNISRAEAVAVLLRQTEIEIMEAPEAYFIDVPDYAWYVDFVYTAVEIGLIQNNGGFVFPNEEITRGEFAFMASSVIDISDCRLVDTDGDGMPDWWEVENNLNPLFAGDAFLDPDFDSFTNLQEFKNGTDPFDPQVIAERCPCIDNPNQNDTDLDGIIDACDIDLDNDTIPNALCMFDENGLIDPLIAATSEDNCIFNENTPQIDTDADGTGDKCLPLDLCPEVPEDFDGINDLDGCPEVDDETPDNDPGVYVNRGPLCYFIDYEFDLVKGDIIMTAITDVDTHDIIFSQSNEATY